VVVLWADSPPLEQAAASSPSASGTASMLRMDLTTGPFPWSVSRRA
jgi:hypothetical protein